MIYIFNYISFIVKDEQFKQVLLYKLCDIIYIVILLGSTINLVRLAFHLPSYFRLSRRIH